MTLQPEKPADRPPTPAGWYASADPKVLRFWDGTKWTDYTAPAASGVGGQLASPDQRRAALAQAIAPALRGGGARVESSADFHAVVVGGQPTNHVLHLILTLATCGLWAPIWLLLAIFNKEKRGMATVDEYGQVHWT